MHTRHTFKGPRQISLAARTLLVCGKGLALPLLAASNHFLGEAGSRHSMSFGLAGKRPRALDCSLDPVLLSLHTWGHPIKINNYKFSSYKDNCSKLNLQC